MTAPRTTTARKAGRDDSYRRDTVVIDWDGVLMPDPDSPWRYVPEELDVKLITECQAAGYAVAISTCAEISRVAGVLEARGIPCWADTAMRNWSWHDGSQVLISNRKIHGRVFLDDHAMHWTYGDDITRLWQRIEADRGYCFCPGEARHHWGPDGAAGLLPWTIRRGELHIALAERSGAVQGGRCHSTPGGAIEPGETPLEAALREAHEELTGLDHVKAGDPYIAPCEAGCSWSYTTYPAEVKSDGEHLPKLAVRKGPHAWETRAVRWFRMGELPAGELHPGLDAALPELLGQIEAIAGL